MAVFNVLEELDLLIDTIEQSAQFTDIHRIDSLQQSCIFGKVLSNIHAVEVPGIKNLDKHLLQKAVNKIHYKYKQCQCVIILSSSPILNDYIGISRKSIMLPPTVLFYNSLNLDDAFHTELKKGFNILDYSQPLYRISVTKDEYVLFTTHHTLFDGRSRIPFWKDFLMLINNKFDFDDRTIKNAPFCETILNDCFIKDPKQHNQFRCELSKYGGAFKLFNDIKLNKNDIVHNLDKYFSDQNVRNMIDLFKSFDLIKSDFNDQFISITNPEHDEFQANNPSKFVYGSVEAIYNKHLVKLCKQYGAKYSITFVYILMWCGIKNMFTNLKELHGKSLLNLNVFDTRFFFDKKKMIKYFGNYVNPMDIIGNYVAVCPNVFEFDVNLKIGSKDFWLKMKKYSNDVSLTSINNDIFYGKEMAKLIEMSKLKNSLVTALTSLGCVDLNKNDYKYKIKKYYRVVDGLDFLGHFCIFGSCIKHVDNYDLVLVYHEPYMLKDDAINIINDVVGIVKDLYLKNTL